MLSTAWDQRKSAYDIVVIGSGYGGAISAARLASANLNPRPSICLLERGKEWQPGSFLETPPTIAAATRSDLNPLGLFELLNYSDISVIKDSGLGGTSLINGNVAIVPDPEVFEQFHWPASVTYDALAPYYQRALRHWRPIRTPAPCNWPTCRPWRSGRRSSAPTPRRSTSSSTSPSMDPTPSGSTRSPASIAATA